MNILVTGRPGVGKTTLAQRVADALIRAGRQVRGFTTGELRGPDGARVGFEIATIDGRRALLAHVDRRGGPRVSKYGVDLAAFEALALPELEPGPSVEIYVIDEIGKMECFSGAFRSAVVRLLDGPAPVVATIALRGDAWMEALKARRDVEVVTLTYANRDGLHHDLLERLNLRTDDSPS